MPRGAPRGLRRDARRALVARRRRLGKEATAALAAARSGVRGRAREGQGGGRARRTRSSGTCAVCARSWACSRRSLRTARLIDALRAENASRARGKAEEALLRETAASTLTAAGSTDPSRPRGGFAGASVPVSVYKTAERRAERADARTRARAAGAAAPREDLRRWKTTRRATTRLTTCSRASSIAAAAADTDPDLPDVSLQHQEDVAALIEHAEALEREKPALGATGVAEQTRADAPRASGREGPRNARAQDQTHSYYDGWYGP